MKAEGLNLRKFKITDVRVNSEAEKVGIQIGDVIQMINGSPAEGFELDNINAILNSKPGRKISIQIERDGKIFKKSFLLENPI